MVKLKGNHPAELARLSAVVHAAPATPIHVYVDSDLYTSIQSSITDNLCGAISISFIYCSSSSSFFTGLDTLFAQAASQDQSVFLARAIGVRAAWHYDATNNSCETGTTQNASEMAASPHVTGTNFAISSSSCTANETLNKGSSCSVGVKFTPHSQGAKTDTLQFADTAPNSPQSVSLSGTGK